LDNDSKILLDKYGEKIQRLEDRRIFQQDIMPQVVNPRHLNVNVDGWEFPNGIILTEVIENLELKESADLRRKFTKFKKQLGV